MSVMPGLQFAGGEWDEFRVAERVGYHFEGWLVLLAFSSESLGYDL